MARSRDSEPITRRGFLGVVSGAAAAMGLGGVAYGWPIGGETAAGPGRRTPFIIPNADFYLVAVDPDFRPSVTPQTVARDWSLTVRGLGEAARRLSYGDLRNEGSAEFLYTFECIGNSVGGDLIGNARWRGVPLRDVLAPVLPDSRSGYTVMFRALDGFYSSISIERCLSDDSFIAHEMNGEPIPAAHGFPARVIVPDLYGMKQPRWLKSIELVESDESTGYWDERGWASEIPVKTMSRLDVPVNRTIVANEPYRLTGIAFAGARGISRVEVSHDDGETWSECRLVEGGDPGVWATWAYDWKGPVSGWHTLVVRAVDGDGEPQIAKASGTYPDGATGYHEVEVEARA